MHAMPNAPLAPSRPTLSFLLRHPAHWIALGFGSGLSPKAPGTAGTLWAWAAWLLLQTVVTHTALGWLVLLGIPLGWWACTVTARNMGIADPGSIVWDEVVAFWAVLWILQPALALEPFPAQAWIWQAAAFAVFRFFDAAKPPPVRCADQRFKGFGWRGGWGILFDDLVAAACSVAVLTLIHASGLHAGWWQ